MALVPWKILSRPPWLWWMARANSISNVRRPSSDMWR